MSLLKTSVTDGFVEIVIGEPETEESSIGAIDGVDPDEGHVYLKVEMKHREGDPIGDIRLVALQQARELIAAEITRLTKEQQAR